VTNRGDRIRPGGPIAYLADGEWPTGPLEADAPTAAVWAAEISEQLAAAIGTDARSVSAVASATGVARSTLYAIMNGTRWPDLVTLGELEACLGTQLLPRSVS
jgi:DNA-binding phage protein